ncbi:MAG: carbohydrate ABC transporter permease [Candidatus Muiribacteriota bacterium]
MQSRKFKETIESIIFLAPFLFVFILFLAYPIVYSLFLSFHEVGDLSEVFSSLEFVGTKHYGELIQDREFWWSVLITFCYALINIPFGIFVALMLALLLSNKLPGKTFFRSAYFLPNVLDILVVSIIWTLIYSAPYGYLLQFLDKIGELNIIGISSVADFIYNNFARTGFLGNPFTALPAIIFALTLKGAGFGMVLFLSALQNIPQDLYEAAKIDGAGKIKTFFSITLPMLKPIILFMVITGFIASLNAFTEIYIMTSGGPNVTISESVPFFGGTTQGATRVTGYHLFRNFRSLKLGYAAAISYVLLFITIFITFLNLKFLKSED